MRQSPALSKTPGTYPSWRRTDKYQGLIRGGQRKITRRNTSRVSNYKYQELRLQNIRAQSEEARVLGCKVGEPS